MDSERVAARIQRPLLNALDQWAADNGVHRTEAVRLLLEKALEIENDHSDA